MATEKTFAVLDRNCSLDVAWHQAELIGSHGYKVGLDDDSLDKLLRGMTSSSDIALQRMFDGGTEYSGTVGGHFCFICYGVVVLTTPSAIEFTGNPAKLVEENYWQRNAIEVARFVISQNVIATNLLKKLSALANPKIPNETSSK